MKIENKSSFVMSEPRCHHVSFSPLSNSGGFSTFSDQTCGFQVAWQINPHMKVGEVDLAAALLQHRQLAKNLQAAGAELFYVPFIHAAYDSVFVKDAAILMKQQNQTRALLANFRHAERQIEQSQRALHLERIGFMVSRKCPYVFEGGDVAADLNLGLAFMGFGFRTDVRAGPYVAQFLNVEVVALELIDPYFFHLDTALTLLSDGTVLAYEGAFSAQSWQTLLNCSKIETLIGVNREEALQFCLNCVEVDDNVIMGSEVSRLNHLLAKFGKRVSSCSLEQFLKAGGSAACLVAKIYEKFS